MKQNITKNATISELMNGSAKYRTEMLATYFSSTELIEALKRSEQMSKE